MKENNNYYTYNDTVFSDLLCSLLLYSASFKLKCSPTSFYTCLPSTCYVRHFLLWYFSFSFTCWVWCY